MTAEQKMSIRLTSLQNSQSINAQRISATKESADIIQILLEADEIFKYLTKDSDDLIPKIKTFVN